MMLVESAAGDGMAVSGRQRSPIAPEIPTVNESGLPGYEMGSWFGLVAPAGTPVPVITRLQQETARALKLPDVRDKLIAQGVDPIGSTPEAQDVPRQRDRALGQNDQGREHETGLRLRRTRFPWHIAYALPFAAP